MKTEQNRQNHNAADSAKHRAAVLVISTSGAAGEREDVSGPTLMGLLQKSGFQPEYHGMVPDDAAAIQAQLLKLVHADYALILTSGGTGFAPSDVTPEATAAVCQKACPGIPALMLTEGLHHTARAALSRAYAGISGRTLIVNFPGSPRACQENFAALREVLPHALAILREGAGNCADERCNLQADG